MNISEASVVSSLAAAFNWWAGELRAIFSLIQLKRNRPNIRILKFKDEWVISLTKGKKTRELARLESESRQSVIRNTVRTVGKHVNVRDADITIVLPQEYALRRSLEVPSAAESDLRKALSFEIDRQTPFESHEVYFDYRVLTRDPGRKQLLVELVAVPKNTADAALAQIESWGLKPTGVDIVTGAGTNGLGINLLDTPGMAGGRYLTFSLYALIVLLLLSALFVPVQQLADLDHSLKVQLSKEKEAAHNTLEMRDNLLKEIKSAQFLDVRKTNTMNSLKILNELTKILPDDTWLMSYQQNTREIKISGYSTSAAQLISVLDDSSIFVNPKFTSSIVQDKRQKLERFEVMFEVVDGGG
jgi:general secretion pathway protein L